MRVPRRLPWARDSDLEQVYHWIYLTSSNDTHGTRMAVNRLTAWAQAVPLPHALEGALGILSARLLDRDGGATATPLVKRHAYAAALIRLVNGLVDPLQLGAYARSITSLAQQLGLPPWLVELRHAATHEDLPSLEVLREGARQSMAWIQDRYFIPTLYPSLSAPPPAPHLRPVQTILQEYKALQKRIVKDKSLTKILIQDVDAVYRDMERWFGEAKVVALAAGGGDILGAETGRNRRDDDIEEDENIEEDSQEVWALERLSEALCERGVLVPISKKKRVLDGGEQGLPPSLVALWKPLLVHLVDHHSSALRVLLRCALDKILDVSDTGKGEGAKADPSYDNCLADWVIWLLHTFGDEGQKERDISILLLFGNLGSLDAPPSNAAHKILLTLCAGSSVYEAAYRTLLNMAEDERISDSAWDEGNLSIMDTRLQSALDALTNLRSPSVPNTEDVTMFDPTTSTLLVPSDPEASSIPLPPGWRLLDEKVGWKPAPIGVFVQCK